MGLVRNGDGWETGEMDEHQDTSTTATPEAVVAALRSWVADAWDPDLALVDWRARLAGAGWAVPSWPRRWYGQDLPAWADDLVARELVKLAAVGPTVGAGMGLAAPTIAALGPDHNRERFLLPAITGAERWCQLFSEPGAGSDLAGLSTRAELDGDEWVVNGQKVWTTGARHADLAILVARTDPTVPKHRGLTFFVISMHQPGVTVRPLRMMNDHASFNEVFLTDARIPREHVVGEVGSGWAAALTTLSFERRFGAVGRPQYAQGPGRALKEARAEADAHFVTFNWYPQRAGRPDLLVQCAEDTGQASDPMVRQAVARVTATQQVSRWTGERAAAARRAGVSPGAEGSVGKLAMSVVARQAAAAHALIGGAAGMLAPPDAPNETVAEVLVSVPAQSIAGGTDEIQHNILGERILGLPREPAVDRDLPWREIPRS